MSDFNKKELEFALKLFNKGKLLPLRLSKLARNSGDPVKFSELFLEKTKGSDLGWELYAKFHEGFRAGDFKAWKELKKHSIKIKEGEGGKILPPLIPGNPKGAKRIKRRFERAVVESASVAGLLENEEFKKEMEHERFVKSKKGAIPLPWNKFFSFIATAAERNNSAGVRRRKAAKKGIEIHYKSYKRRRG